MNGFALNHSPHYVVTKSDTEISDIKCASMLFGLLVKVESESQPGIDRSSLLGEACWSLGRNVPPHWA